MPHSAAPDCRRVVVEQRQCSPPGTAHVAETTQNPNIIPIRVGAPLIIIDPFIKGGAEILA